MIRPLDVVGPFRGRSGYDTRESSGTSLPTA
jgi:hypothetical protein